MKQQRSGVIGWFADFDNAYARTVAICDVNEARVKDWGTAHPEHAGYVHYREMLASELVSIR